MEQANLVNRVLALPEIKKLIFSVEQGGMGLNLQTLKEDIEKASESAIQKVAGDYSWDFVIRDSSISSEVNVSEYALPGAANDAMSIYSVKYNDTPLQWKTRYQMDIILAEGDITAIEYFMLQEPENGHPKIQIFGTPSLGTDTIYYSYWRNNVQIGEFPSTCDRCLVYALASEFIPVYYDLYKAELRDAIAGYSRYGMGRGTMEQDPVVRAGNIRRAAMHGW